MNYLNSSAFVHREVKNWINRETATHGLEAMGYKVELVSAIDEIPTGDYPIVYGGVNFVRSYINREGLHVPHMGEVPEEAIPLAGRKIERMTLKEALKDRRYHFIKPIPTRQKMFTGFVYNEPMDLLNVAQYDDNEEVLVSPKMNIITEHRVYVYDREVSDSKRYKGSFRTMPDISIADKLLEVWPAHKASSFSIDLGLDSEGNKTFVVECNDAFSLGFYGIATDLAAAMLVNRWEQIYFRSIPNNQ